MMETNEHFTPLTPELAALAAELSSIRIEERASFAPELEAELRSEAARLTAAPDHPIRRLAVAACAALLIGGAVALPARAALVALMQRLSPPPVPAAPARVAAPPAPVVEPTPPPSLPTRGLLTPQPLPAEPVRTIPPRVLDLEEQQRMIRRYYPDRLQRQRVGGIVNVLAWVDSAGVVGDVQIRQSSGHPDIDGAALAAAPRLTFRPALREGRPVATWVQFDLVFAPEGDALPMRPLDPASLPDPGVVEVPPAWTGVSALPAPTLQEATVLLRRALGGGAPDARLGTLDDIIVGEAPAGSDPLAWRADATAALEAAIARAPHNPAPFLALARILRKQGLHDDALALLEQGIARAEQGGDAFSPRLTAELHYELGIAARAAWRARAHLGRLPVRALAEGSCARAPRVSARGDDADAAVPAATLIAWNYLCPAELSRILAAGFQPDPAAWSEREAMRRSFFSAIAADPGHVGANVELLLDMADDGDPRRLLATARRFAYASRGHPYARLLTGLALERIGRSEDALEELEAGLEGLTREEADRIRDVGPLLDGAAARRLAALEGDERAQELARFWAALDPLVSTPVNERRVVHLARSVYAHLRLGGAATEAGDLWIRYGAPLAVRAVGEGNGLRTELWEYADGPAVTLRRLATSAVLELTPEGRAYLNDLRATRPYAYGRGGRSIEELPVRVRRLVSEEGAPEIEVATRVPEGLRSGADTLVLALVELDPEGERVGQQRVRIPPSDEGVTVRLRPDEDARHLAIEIFNPSLARAAVTQVPVRLENSPPLEEARRAR